MTFQPERLRLILSFGISSNMEFENLGYRELQNLCKDFGLRANGKSAELKERLRDYKLKLQASTTSHRRSSVNSNLAFPISALQEDETGLNIDETLDVECPNENNFGQTP